MPPPNNPPEFKKLSNVIGAPFKRFVTNQLATRAVLNSTTDRTLSEVLFLANKTAWVKLQSSVYVSGSVMPTQNDNRNYYDLLKDQYTVESEAFLPEWTKTSTSLAKNWILQSGTSKLLDNGDLALRYGLGLNNAYGLGGIVEQGYRPMPGLDNVTIETKGRLGSLRFATINFKVWNMNQLDIIDGLYFRLGFTMLLEWGHTQYYANVDDPTIQTAQTNVSGIDLFFKDGVTKAQIQNAINQKIFETQGNYDGMLGVVTNYTCAMNQDGGWDCSIKLIGLGTLIDTQRITSQYNMPPGVALAYDKAKAEREKKIRDQKIKDAQIEANKTNAGLQKDYDAKVKAYDAAVPIKSIEDLINKIPYKGKTNQETAANISPIMYFGGASGFQNILNDNAPDNGSIVTVDLRPLASQPPASYDVDSISDLLKSSTILTYTYSGQPRHILPKTSKGRTPAYAFENPLKVGSIVQLEIGTINTLTAINSDSSIAVVDAGAVIPSVYTINDYIGGKDALESFKRFKTAQKTGLGALLLVEGESTNFTNIQDGDYNKVGSNDALYRAAYKQVYIKPDGTTDNNARVYIQVAIRNIVAPDASKASLRLAPNTNRDTREAILTKIVEAINADGAGSKAYFTLTRDPVAQTTGPYSNAVLLKMAQEKDFAGNDVYYEVDLGSSYKFEEKTPSKTVRSFDKILVKLYIETTMTSLLIADIKTPGAPTPPSAPTLATVPANAGDLTDLEKQQAEKANGLESALQAMLTIITWKGSAESGGKQHAFSIEHDTGMMVKGTENALFGPIFKEVKGKKSSTYELDIDAIEDYLYLVDRTSNPLSLGLKGFNTSMMSRQTNSTDAIKNYDECLPTSQTDVIDMLRSLMVAYVVPYEPSNTTEDNDIADLDKPVYIKLGYLLFFLNNYCLLYDTTKTKTNNQTKLADPFFYLDFNPITNLCFKLPEQIAIDPFKCIIPFSGGDAGYKRIFKTIQPSDVDKVAKFKPSSQDALSPFLSNTKVQNITLPSYHVYQTEGTDYRGRHMNILLNTQYLLDLLKSSTESDGHGGVYLKPFLDAVMTDVNKALGDVNLFRVAYFDTSNTVAIVDDQFVQPLPAEANVIHGAALVKNRNQLISSYGNIILPVQGVDSLVREFQLETNMSTKMSSMIAIGATAGTASADGIDGSSLRALHGGLYDRIVLERGEVNTQPSVVKTSNDNNNNVASEFDLHITRVYGGAERKVDTSAVLTAQNFLILNAAKLKAGNQYTNANPVIPYNTSFTIDGISGIVMANSFLLPNKILPLSVRGNGAVSKFGFMVTKLDHTIQNNEWLTKISGQMIKLKDVLPPGAVGAIGAGTYTFSGNGSSATGVYSYDNPAEDGKLEYYLEGAKNLTYRERKGIPSLIDTEFIPAYKLSKVSVSTPILYPMLVAHAITEGWTDKKNLAYKLKNPGCVGICTDCTPKKLTEFPTLADGIDAMYDRVLAYAYGKSGASWIKELYRPDTTIIEYVYHYAPPYYKENGVWKKSINNPFDYATSIVSTYWKYGYKNITALTTLKELGELK